MLIPVVVIAIVGLPKIPKTLEALLMGILKGLNFEGFDTQKSMRFKSNYTLNVPFKFKGSIKSHFLKKSLFNIQ